MVGVLCPKTKAVFGGGLVPPKRFGLFECTPLMQQRFALLGYFGVLGGFRSIRGGGSLRSGALEAPRRLKIPGMQGMCGCKGGEGCKEPGGSSAGRRRCVRTRTAETRAGMRPARKGLPAAGGGAALWPVGQGPCSADGCEGERGQQDGANGGGRQRGGWGKGLGKGLGWGWDVKRLVRHGGVGGSSSVNLPQSPLSHQVAQKPATWPWGWWGSWHLSAGALGLSEVPEGGAKGWNTRRN